MSILNGSRYVKPMATSAEDACLELTEADIPGVSFDEQSHCSLHQNGGYYVTMPVSKKPTLIERCVNNIIWMLANWCLIHID